jgi:enolase
MKITSITARMILDSRGYPTVEVDMTIENTFTGRASVPSGASTGSHEALELRDNDEAYGGKGVHTALAYINNELAPRLYESDFTSQRNFDAYICELDGTKNKSHFGANTLLALSLAFGKAVAKKNNQEFFEYIRNEYAFTQEMSLPMPLINVLNGGKHATSSTDVQEWMIIPIGATSFTQALEMGTKVFYELRSMMSKRGSSAVGDEGGFPLSHVTSNKEALVILSEAVTASGLVLGKDIAFGLDVAASELFENGTYNLAAEKKTLTSSEMISWFSELVAEFPIISIEDGLAEDDWDSWKALTEALGNKIQLVGDDLFVTNTEFIKKGIDMGVATAVLIKPNQIGTLSETVDAILLAQGNNLRTIISHRSGETEDTSIAHLAVASGSGQIKTGSLSRTERLAKYNELLRIGEKVPHFTNPFN